MFPCTLLHSFEPVARAREPINVLAPPAVAALRAVRRLGRSRRLIVDSSFQTAGNRITEQLARQSVSAFGLATKRRRMSSPPSAETIVPALGLRYETGHRHAAVIVAKQDRNRTSVTDPLPAVFGVEGLLRQCGKSVGAVIACRTTQNPFYLFLRHSRLNYFILRFSKARLFARNCKRNKHSDRQ